MDNKSKKILSEISAGELLDKISILEIKLAKVKDKESHVEINKEYKILKEVQKFNISTGWRWNLQLVARNFEVFCESSWMADFFEMIGKIATRSW